MADLKFEAGSCPWSTDPTFTWDTTAESLGSWNVMHPAYDYEQAYGWKPFTLTAP